MAFDMNVVAERAARAYAETLEATTRIQLYERRAAQCSRCCITGRAQACRWWSSATTSSVSPALNLAEQRFAATPGGQHSCPATYPSS